MMISWLLGDRESMLRDQPLDIDLTVKVKSLNGVVYVGDGINANGEISPSFSAGAVIVFVGALWYVW
jgi:hypothetical protein